MIYCYYAKEAFILIIDSASKPIRYHFRNMFELLELHIPKRSIQKEVDIIRKMVEKCIYNII